MSRNAQAWAVLTAAYPNWNMTLESVAVWDALLSHSCTPEALLAGAVRFAQTSVYPPTIAGWLAAAQASDPATAQRLTAAEAWNEMYRNRHGRYTKPPAWSSEAVLRAARAVRWDDPDWLSEQIPTIRAQFERYYNALADKTERIDGGRDAQEIAQRLTSNSKLLYGPGAP